MSTSLAACTSGSAPRGTDASTRASAGSEQITSVPPSSAPAPACPASYAKPDSNRPKLTLGFTVSPDHKVVNGTEHVTFIPDRSITQLVFRLTANTAASVADGTSTIIESATADHGAGHFRFTRAGAAAGTQGGLLHLPFNATLPAGTVIHAMLRFRVNIGVTKFDRFGRVGSFAYFGSGEPLLAWQRGYGWHTEPLANFDAESATSEAMDVELTVRAPATDVVIMSGDPATPPKRSSGTRTWHSHIPTARDVSVALGPFATAGKSIGDVALRVGASTAARARVLVSRYAKVLATEVKLFGPYPFASLSVADIGDAGGGIEYPSSILAFNASSSLAAHETAHQWFYAMVGDSQSLHPWLDEAFANYAEDLVDGTTGIDRNDLADPTPVDSSIASYGTDGGEYQNITYEKGATALLAARKAAGATVWGKALRCYVAANAWRIAIPEDVENSIRNLPAAVRVLREAGAIP